MPEVSTSAPINRAKFYDSIKPALFPRGFTKSQVQGIECKLTVWELKKLPDLRWLAYMFATVFHETGAAMMPVEENGKGRGRDYGKMLKMGGGPGKRIPYTAPNKLYYGRGDVQLTWFENYELMSRLLGVDLLNNPELMLNPVISCKVLFEGMTKGASSFGDFTGRCLEQYFNAKIEDPINARRIINSLDQANTIAGYYKVFLKGLL